MDDQYCNKEEGVNNLDDLIRLDLIAMKENKKRADIK